MPRKRGGPRASRMLARGWSQDNQRWTWATTAVLASTLTVLLGTSGLMEGTTARTLDEVAGFYTGELRLTPSRAGALPGDWFDLAPADGGQGAADQLRAAGLVVSERVEAQYVLSRRGFADTYLNEPSDVPIGVPGTGADPRKVVTLGALVGISAGDPGERALLERITAGRLPRPSQSDTVEIVVSESRARSFLTADEARVPAGLLEVVGSFGFDITSARIDPDASQRAIIYRPARVVGIYATGVEMLDSFTVLAAAQDVRELLGRGRDEPLANVLAVQSGSVASAQAVAQRNGWATQDVDGFADLFVGQLIGVLQAMAVLVSALLFLLPAALMGHGLARQLASQQRELAVATAIGVPRRTLADALTLQVVGMAAWACLMAAVAAAVLAVVVPAIADSVPAPLPLGFLLTWRAVLVAAAVTVVAVVVSLWVGLRSRARLPLSAALRAA